MTDLSRSALAIRASVFAELAPRIEAHARAGGDLVALHIGDTYLAPPPGARFGRVEPDETDPALYVYGALPGLDALKQAFVRTLAAAGRGPAGADAGRHVLVGAGATHAIYCGLRAVLDAGDEVVVAAPYWPLSVGVVRAAGGVPVEVPLTSRLYEDPAASAAAIVERALTPRTRALYLISPNNPDGYVYTEAQLRELAALAVARDLWVLSDEVYADYVYEGAHASIARMPGMGERTLSAYSLSKSHALAGARVGFLVAPERVVGLARRVATHTVFNVPVASQRVALAALEAPAGWMHDARAAYRAARDAALAGLAGSGVRAFAPKGGSYVFVDFTPVLGGKPLRGLLERAIDRGVLLAPGDGCGDAYGAWARLCFTSVPRERLTTGVARLREALGELGGG
ncbi:MAG TPA: pyridoxal phosphate-dependent aminotransferase [Polyangiaceae bacterium]|nr:pyridoxal phosphate-dependent aminotransferase [Polyangiaceae bacterium]